ncbi:T9SS type A sorting domain-containing protein [Polluticoccus soli]|uniref:T9SS type A sorting domain-containing protein n=1 Tax=Polluticoccus soli TaxID=3034150 RepID=UPI0023E2821A|nr:T9SS type A sorting domain-containing protein [Flavipsychrobacter sp. JY13-12]
MMKFLNPLLPIALLIQANAQAQFEGSIYRTDGTYLSSVRLTVDGVEKKMAWCGGVNNPMFAVPDLNNDGVNDLVIWEASNEITERGTKTFVNKGTPGQPNYFYAPEFEYLFPYVSGYMKMIDYNCDGIQDLFYGSFGLSICDGYYNSNSALAFKNCRDIKYYYPGSSNASNITVGNGVPSIVDVDNDGDLDFLSFSDLGNWIDWYKNIKTEKGFSCDTFALQLKDRCWGRVFQPGGREHVLHQWCDNSMFNNQPKTTHGSNTLCLLDHDGDGDYDVLNGNDVYSDLQFLRNNRIQFGNSVDSMTWQDTMWQSNGTKAHMARYPLATHIDIDGDGARDIPISPRADFSENYRSIQYYRNAGTDANPSFIYQTNTLLVDRMLDMGSNSYPVFYDYNRDGKLDLLVGSRGYYQPNGTFKPTIWYFQNTGSGSNISFNLAQKDLLKVDTLGIDGASLAIGDLDNDGLDDMVVGHSNGTLSFFRNYAASSNAQPDWHLSQKLLRDQNSTEINVGNSAAPLIYDINADGKKDLLIGCQAGTIFYYKNIGGSGLPSLEYVTNKLGDVRVDGYLSSQMYTWSAPFIGQMDNTGKEYLVVGSGFGRISRYDGFQNGNVTTPYTLIDSQYSGVQAPGQQLAPAIGDLNGDGKYEMMVGNTKGGLLLYRQVWNVSVNDLTKEAELHLYPNPASRKLTIESKDALLSAEVRMFNVVGQLVHTQKIAVQSTSFVVDIAHLKPGVYVCSLINMGKVRNTRFTKLN